MVSLLFLLRGLRGGNNHEKTVNVRKGMKSNA